MFWTGCIYGGRNDAERFGFFCHAALEFLLQRGSQPVSLMHYFIIIVFPKPFSFINVNDDMNTIFMIVFL